MNPADQETQKHGEGRRHRRDETGVGAVEGGAPFGSDSGDEVWQAGGGCLLLLLLLVVRLLLVLLGAARSPRYRGAAHVFGVEAQELGVLCPKVLGLPRSSKLSE